MRKIFVKLPDPRVKKFRLQREGWKSRRFLKATGILNRLERVFPPNKLKEKTAIVVKEYIDSHFVNINETLASKDPKYLLFTLTCFLEDHIEKYTLNRKYKKYELRN